jgi:hypothetical protein
MRLAAIAFAVILGFGLFFIAAFLIGGYATTQGASCADGYCFEWFERIVVIALGVGCAGAAALGYATNVLWRRFANRFANPYY